MQFTRNAHVYTSDRQQVGHITHVVLDPDTKKVTHVVVRQGIILTEDKVVPIELLQSSDPEGVILREDVGDLHGLLIFEEAHYVQVDLPHDVEAARLGGTVSGFYLWYPPALPTPSINDIKKHGQYMVHRTVRRLEKNIPAGEVALKEGAEVISVDDHPVGHIESVLVDPQTEQMTNIVIARHVLLATHRRLVPVAWVHSVYENTVFLTVTEAELKDVPEYA